MAMAAVTPIPSFFATFKTRQSYEDTVYDGLNLGQIWNWDILMREVVLCACAGFPIEDPSATHIPRDYLVRNQ